MGLSFFIILPSIAAYGTFETNCKSLFIQSTGSSIASQAQARAAWNTETTDPNEYDPNRFLLVLHAVPREKTKERIQRERNEYERKNSLEPVEMIDLIDQPGRIKEIPRLSFSLVSQNHSFTIGPSGVIIKFHGDQLISTFPKDSRTGGWRFSSDSESLKSENKKLAEISGRILTPKELDAASYADVHNEGMIETATSSSEAKVIGYFYKIDEYGNAMVSKNELNTLRQQAKVRNLPLIAIRGGSWRDDTTGTHRFPISR